MQKKTWAAGITTAAIVTTTLAAPGIAQAQPGTTTLSAVGSPLLSTRSWAPFDNDALFSEFVNRLFYGGPFVSFYSTSGHDQLSGLALEVYDALHDEITPIALGEHTSTKDIMLPEHTWTLEELGIEYNGHDTDFGPATTLYSDAISRALDALLDDCPYELYWYDKTGDNGGGTRMLFSISCDSIEVTLTPSVSMGVALDYRADPADAYTVDGTDAQRALKARVKAQEIVTKNENKSDYEKLNAYRDAICELVSYDDEAADPSTQTPYGDPWQIVSVFDGEGETKVVCEGYAKAFQYLCDLSHFNSNIRCTTVHGVMDGGTGAGNHMWNVIRMGDGRTYLVDVTNSDTGTIGQDGGLFIENYDHMIGNDYCSGYVFKIGDAEISYIYDKATLDLYPADYLTISHEPYDDSAVVVDVDLSDATVSVSGTYTYTGAAQTPPADALTVTVNGETVPTDAYTVQASDNVNAGTATVTVTAKEGSGYTGSATGTFVIGRATPQVSVSHSGGQVFPSTPLEDIEKNLQVTSNVKGALALGDAELTVGENALAWTFTPEDSANYETVTGTLTLTVSEDVVTSIAITTPPTKTSYAYGEAFDPAGMVVTATYASGRTEPVSGYAVEPAGPLTTVGENTITVSYKGSTATLSVTVAPQAITPTVTLSGAEGLVYDGSEQRPAVSVTADGSALDPAEYVVTYADNVSAGTATVMVSDAAGGRYQFEPVTASFEIARARLVPSVEGTTSKTYDGTTAVTGGDLAIALAGVVAGDDVTATATYSYADANAGEGKDVLVSGLALAGADAANYELTASELTAAGVGSIAKATLSGAVTYEGPELWTGSDLSEVAQGLTWAGTPADAAVSLAPGTALVEGTRTYACTVTPADTQNYETLETTVELTVARDVVTSIAVTTPPTKTSYTYGEAFDPAGMVVTATYASGATSEVAPERLSFSPEELTVATTQVSVAYEGMSATVGVTVAPRAVTPTLELTGADGLVYSGRPQEPGVVARDGDAAIPASEYVVTYQGNVDAGTATVSVSDAPGGNYEVDTASATFEIAPARPALSVSAPAGGATYGSPVALALTLEGVAGEAPSATATVTVDGVEHQVVITNGSGALELDGLEAGKHAVSASVPAAGNYEAATASASFSLAKATPQVTVTEVNPDLVVYPTTDRTLVASNYAAQADPAVEGTLSVELPASLTPGDHECAWTFTPADTGNYEVVRGTVTLTVVEDSLASIAVTTPPTKTSYTYGEAFDPAGMVVTATWASGRTADVSGAVSYEAALAVGQTEVELAYASGGRTVTCAVPVTVSARAVTPTLALTGAEGLVYTGSALEPGVVAMDGDAVVPASEYVVSYANNVDAGTATVTVTDAPGGNYEVGTASTTFEIARAQAALSVSARTEGAAVGDPVTLSVSLTGVSGRGLDGTVTVRVDGADHEVAVAGGAGSLTLEGLDEARTYEVSASFAGAANYEPATAATSFSIARDTPEVSVTYAGGQIFPTTPLSEVEKNLQVASDVPGTLSLDATELQVGTHDYAWTFTPADPAAYNEVTGSVTLTVSRDALTGIELTSAPSKTSYVFGEAFDPAGMVVTATYASGRTADVTALVSFERALEVGQTSVALTFADGADVATATVGVTVAPCAVTPTLELTGADGLVYNGRPQEPVVSVLVDGEPLSASEYVVTYQDNVDAGTATVTVTDAPGGNYEVATATATFEIARARYGIEVPALDATFDGTPVDLTTDDVTVIGYGQEVLVTLSWQERTEDGWRQLDAAPSEVGSYRLVVTVTSEDPNYEPTTERAFEFSILASAEETPEPGDGGQGGTQGGARPGGTQTPAGQTPGTQAPGATAPGTSGHGPGELPGTGDATTLAGTLGALLAGGLASVAAAVRSLRHRP
ncbi:bacterial Ig-like domain-containing protein [Olsenella sp. An290]|uniref:bacterial Ig-like domain-containing protein n=1 Tax=Olsenella sp. An290 TaxID=1965625 RepID=UPI001302765B|nr:bacterial Ig-like domain-containing protein [Olsenella sp. An290]